MSYGFRFEDVCKVRRPERIKTEYGQRLDIINEPEFSLSAHCFRAGGGSFPCIYYKGGNVLFVEKGKLISRFASTLRNQETYSKLLLEQGDVLELPKLHNNGLFAEVDSFVYQFAEKLEQGHVSDKCVNADIIDTTTQLFACATEGDNKGVNARKTFDAREKYWGSIETIVSNESFAGKRIVVRPRQDAEGRFLAGSLEYHLKKKEAYFLQSGKLKVGLRVGRAENRSVVLNPGDVFVINPGVMHTRIPLEESVIIEISTPDDDRDSHLVEDGEKGYLHREQ